MKVLHNKHTPNISFECWFNSDLWPGGISESLLLWQGPEHLQQVKIDMTKRQMITKYNRQGPEHLQQNVLFSFSVTISSTTFSLFQFFFGIVIVLLRKHCWALVISPAYLSFFFPIPRACKCFPNYKVESMDIFHIWFWIFIAKQTWYAKSLDEAHYHSVASWLVSHRAKANLAYSVLNISLQINLKVSSICYFIVLHCIAVFNCEDDQRTLSPQDKDFLDDTGAISDGLKTTDRFVQAIAMSLGPSNTSVLQC